MSKDNKTNIRKFDLIHYVRVCLKQWKLFLASLICFGIIGAVFIATRKPTVQINAQLMLPIDTTSGGGGLLSLTQLAASFDFGDMFGGSSAENEMTLMKSHTVMLKTATELGLNVTYLEKTGFLKWMPAYAHSQLQLTTLPTIPDTLGNTLLFKIEMLDNGNFDAKMVVKKENVYEKKDFSLPATLDTPYGPFTIAKTQYFGRVPVEKFKIIYKSYNAASEEYNDLVSVFVPNKKADLIGMSFLTTNAEFGKLLLNTIIDNYNERGTLENVDRNDVTLDFVNNRIAEIEGELALAESNMERFKKEHNLTNIDVDAATLIQKSGTLESSILMAQTENEILNNTRIFLSNPENKYSMIPNVSSTGGAGTTDGVSQIIAMYNELILQRISMASSAKGNNPALKQLDEKIDAMRENIIESVNRTYQNSTTALNELKKESKLTQSRMGSIPTLEKEYVNLELNLMIKQQLYAYLLKQKEEASMNRSKETVSLVTIDAPYAFAKPVGLEKKMIAIIVLFLAIMMPMVWVFFISYPRSAYYSLQDLSTLTPAPIIGQVQKAPNSDYLQYNDHSDGNTIRRLRNETTRILDDLKGKVIMIASTKAGEGKTHTAVNLAATYALAGKRVLLIDSNMRSPMIDSVFGLSNKQGLSYMLECNSSELEKQTQTVAVDNYSLSVIVAGTPAANPSDLLGTSIALEIIEEARARYDFIIIDTASLREYSDALSLAETADITLYITRKGLTTPADTEFLNNQLTEGRLRRIAVVDNADNA